MDHTEHNAGLSIGDSPAHEHDATRAGVGGAGRWQDAGVGLSKAHIPPQVGKAAFVRSPHPAVTVAVGGSLLQVKSGRQGRAGVGGKRGKVAAFSRASRRRLLYLLNSLNKLAIPYLPLFVTLTYPGTYSNDYRRWKDDLDALYKRICRQYSAANISIIWRLEPQKRGAPHFHLFVFGVQFIPHTWLARAWFEVVGSNDVAHLQAGTQVERVKSWRGVNSYASKYVAKLADESVSFEYVGRWWGIKGKKHLPVSLYNEALNLSQFYFMRRVIRRFLRRFGVRLPVGRYAGASVFLPYEVSLRLLEYLEQQE